MYEVFGRKTDEKTGGGVNLSFGLSQTYKEASDKTEELREKKGKDWIFSIKTVKEEW